MGVKREEEEEAKRCWGRRKDQLGGLTKNEGRVDGVTGWTEKEGRRVEECLDRGSQKMRGGFWENRSMNGR